MDPPNEYRSNESAYEPYRHADGSEPFVPPAQPRSINVRSRSRGRLHKFRIALRILSAALSLAICGVLASTIETWTSSKDRHILWEHGLTLKTWPGEIKNAIPAYTLMGAAAVTALFNIIALITHIGTASTSRFVTAIAFLSHLISIAMWITSLLFSSLHKPSLRSWSCGNMAYQAKMKGNESGLNKVCIETTAVLVAGIMVALIEGLNLGVLIPSKKSDRINWSGKSVVRSIYPGRAYKKIGDNGDGLEVPMLDVPRGSMQ